VSVGSRAVQAAKQAAQPIRAGIRAAVRDGTLGDLPLGISFSVRASDLRTMPGVTITVYGARACGGDIYEVTPLRRELLKIANRHWRPAAFPGGFTDVRFHGLNPPDEETVRLYGPPSARGNISGNPEKNQIQREKEMSKVQDVISDALVAELTSHTEWDEPPALHTVYYGGGKAHIGTVSIPNEVWASGPPALVLESLAASPGSGPHTELLRVPVPANLHGVAFFCETWMVEAKPGTAEGADLRRRAAAVGHRVSQLPERVEARMIWCVDRAGINYSVMQQRGEEPGVMRDVTYPKPGNPAGASGTVTDALDKLVTAFLGVTLPSRDDTEGTWDAWDQAVQP
jgi:hypothetical protein